jgi:hypothetical protein
MRLARLVLGNKTKGAVLSSAAIRSVEALPLHTALWGLGVSERVGKCQEPGWRSLLCFPMNQG